MVELDGLPVFLTHPRPFPTGREGCYGLPVRAFDIFLKPGFYYLQGMASLGVLIFLRVKLLLKLLIKERYIFLGMQSLKYINLLFA